jgi:hypothetical protein
MSDQPVATGRLTGRTAEANITLRQDCSAPAPLVVNGGTFVGCSREQGHEGQHQVTITWSPS